MSTPSSLTRSDSGPLRSVDRDLLGAMRDGEFLGIGELTEALNVTATAVRQRIERLLERGMIEREKVVSGRGRPTYRYRITDRGLRVTGADSTELAEAMWEELRSIEDVGLRERLMRSVATRLGREYASQLNDDDSLEQRMRVLSQLLASRRVSSDVISASGLPVLDISSCPYPTFADGSHDHSMCRLEEQVLSEALGKPVQLSMCRLDGDACCQFSPAENSAGGR
ncbi:winged helix-turn-helix transcriptional regulator [Roseiconus nitratireducens]|uniref:Winged helix-turn-helix transcriptional regulator n=1 Tax=Roseiconus nitratireducens TaxID=2605748 RepID=A0A5M6DGG0_9BACT|nr:winged helix-turn-helix transcriptional regulator [Roseiconus nitratireducens]KAA5544315.1 winged helix-turn-helix transcriptional regulator [Roseiconus nitratireducens]